MKVGQLVEARTPRGTVKRGRFVASHVTHNGEWWEIHPVFDDGSKIRGATTWRSRPGSVTEVSK